MQTRINPYTTAPDAIKPMVAMEDYLKTCGLEHSLIHLVKMRASQINGCAYCLHMHSNDARAAGETEARLYLLRRLARVAALHAARACGAGLDRRADADVAETACAGRGLRRGARRTSTERRSST